MKVETHRQIVHVRSQNHAYIDCRPDCVDHKLDDWKKNVIKIGRSGKRYSAMTILLLYYHARPCITNVEISFLRILFILHVSDHPHHFHNPSLQNPSHRHKIMNPPDTWTLELYFRMSFLLRDAMQARPVSSCGVCPSVTFMSCVKTNKRIIIFLLSVATSF